MHKQKVGDIDGLELARLKNLGVVQSFGTRKQTHGYQVIVSLSRVSGYGYSDRSLVPANYAGTRYVYRERLGDTIFHTYRLRKLDPAEYPEHGRLRIVTPVALEAST
jgi:hypothetical protein